MPATSSLRAILLQQLAWRRLAACTDLIAAPDGACDLSMPAAACRTLLHREFQAGNRLHCRFHVDDLSSAHVYLRLPEGVDMDTVPADTLEDCCQLVKHNSISGNKLSNVGIVYTPWANLRKTASMEVGQVRFASSVVTARQHGGGEREHCT